MHSIVRNVTKYGGNVGGFPDPPCVNVVFKAGTMSYSMIK